MTSRNSDSREKESNGISCQILSSICLKLPGIGRAVGGGETLNNLSEIAIYLVKHRHLYCKPFACTIQTLALSFSARSYFNMRNFLKENFGSSSAGILRRFSVKSALSLQPFCGFDFSYFFFLKVIRKLLVCSYLFYFFESTYMKMISTDK